MAAVVAPPAGAPLKTDAVPQDALLEGQRDRERALAGCEQWRPPAGGREHKPPQLSRLHPATTARRRVPPVPRTSPPGASCRPGHAVVGAPISFAGSRLTPYTQLHQTGVCMSQSSGPASIQPASEQSTAGPRSRGRTATAPRGCRGCPGTPVSPFTRNYTGARRPIVFMARPTCVHEPRTGDAPCCTPASGNHPWGRRTRNSPASAKTVRSARNVAPRLTQCLGPGP
jgi:hypothetical protein